MNPVRGLIFDLNGTMVDDMEYHLVAWEHLLNQDLSAGLDRETIRRNMYGKNPEVFQRLFGPLRFSEQETEALSLEKERRYQQAYRPHLRLIGGLQELLDQLKLAQIPLAIGSAAIPFNIDFVLDNLKLRPYFQAIVSADDVRLSKPHPQTFLLAAERLKLPAADCLVFEDAPKGVEAAQRAGMQAIALTTLHAAEEFSGLNNIQAFIRDYRDTFIEQTLIPALLQKD